jgi:predicted ATPase
LRVILKTSSLTPLPAGEGKTWPDPLLGAPGSRRLYFLHYALFDSVLTKDCFSHAIAVARRQNAKSWELRATASLARLLASQGRRDEASRMLSEIYGWFTEGFDTADLKGAKALLDELNQ